MNIRKYREKPDTYKKLPAVLLRSSIFAIGLMILWNKCSQNMKSFEALFK